MSVTILIIGDNESAEGRAARKLKEIFRRGLPTWASGKVYIIPNVKLIGQKIKDIDIVVFGKFENQKYPQRRQQHRYKKWYQSDSSKDELIEEEGLVDIKVSSFCYAIELKRHDPASVSYKADKIWVSYEGKPEDVSEQSFQQAISLKNSLLPSLSPRIDPKTGQEKDPWMLVSHAVWLWGFDSHAELKELTADPVKAGVLPRDFELWDLFAIGMADHPPLQARNNTTCYWGIGMEAQDELNESIFNDLREKYTVFKSSVGRLTRDKLEKITTSILKEQKYASEIGNKLVIFSGRAGTGKTIKLLRIAIELALDHDKSCLLLTYNNALVSDVMRLLHLADLPDGAEESTVHIQTLDSFFFRIAHSLDLCNDFSVFDRQRDTILKSLIDEWIKPGILKREDLFAFVSTPATTAKPQSENAVRVIPNLVYDFVMVDECQDWTINERDTLLQIFGTNSVVVADGVDQMIRRPYHLNWAEGLPKDAVYKPPREKTSLRQKSNLVEFTRLFAELSRLPEWEVQPRDNLPGGRVTIVEGIYTPAMHRSFYNDCFAAGNRAYEMMLLVPPSFVSKTPEGKRFTVLPLFSEINDVKFWDGTRDDLRKQYAGDPDEFRLLQYDSCRGLEAWTVVCLNFDEFVEEKDRVVREKPELRQEQGQIMLALGEFAHEYSYRWGMIPVTRAVDHIVLTLRKRDSAVGKILRQIADQLPDFVEWRNASEYLDRT